MNVRAAAVSPPRESPFWAISMAITAAWLIMLIGQVSGNAAALHHHALIGGDTPIAIAIPTFLVAWLIMVVAMMWPASLHAVDAFRRGSPNLSRSTLAITQFLGISAVIWAGFGLATFIGDFAVHHVVDTSPWLSARPWLIEAGVLTAAGVYQLTPLKRHYLAACRRPGDRSVAFAIAEPDAIGAGLRHGLDCLGSSWALMLFMFASGFTSLALMGALTLLMVYEATGRHGERAATAAGVVLLLAALTVLSGPLPGMA
jgi:predicted metal-binding membrane protein